MHKKITYLFFEALSKAKDIVDLGRKTKSIIDFYNMLHNFIGRKPKI